MRDSITLFDRVADDVDIQIVGLVRLIDPDTATWPQREAGDLSEADIRSNADRTNNEFSGQDPPVSQRDRSVLDRRDRCSRLDVNAVSN